MRGKQTLNTGVKLSPAALEDVDFLVENKISTSLWPYEDLLPTDKAAVAKEITERINSDWYKQYIIRLDDSAQTPIGELHIHWYVKERESWEMGFALFPEYRGQGFCTEAARIALKLAFEEWNAHRVVAMCNEHNTASSKVLERLGLVLEGVFREEIFWEGKWVDQYFYAMLDSEYRSSVGKML